MRIYEERGLKMEGSEEHLVKREWGWGRGLVTFKRGLLADGAPDGRPSTILQAGKILKLFFLNIHWISIRPQAYLDGHRTFLSKIETFTEVPFIISRTFFVNTEHCLQIDWEVNVFFSDLLSSQYIVQWKCLLCFHSRNLDWLSHCSSNQGVLLNPHRPV